MSSMVLCVAQVVCGGACWVWLDMVCSYGPNAMVITSMVVAEVVNVVVVLTRRYTTN